MYIFRPPRLSNLMTLCRQGVLLARVKYYMNLSISFRHISPFQFLHRVFNVRVFPVILTRLFYRTGVQIPVLQLRGVYASVSARSVNTTCHFRLLVTTPRILRRPVLPMSSQEDFVHHLSLVMPFTLFRIFLHAPMLFTILLPVNFRVNRVPQPNTFPNVTRINTIRRNLEVLLLSLFRGVLLSFNTTFYTSPILRLRVRRFVVINLRPRIRGLYVHVQRFRG